jgi:radical SAM protein with 4Fe4S-binding SPASM domain
MKAQIIDGKIMSNNRHELAEVLPLDTPYLVEIFPIYHCNFKCKYCIYSTPIKERGFISSKRLMDLDLYKKCIDDISKFPQKIKVLRFAGMGEPLLHPHIVEMVDYANKKGITEKIEILTNASKLDYKMSDDLIRAGLGRLYVSLQGLTSEKYLEVCGYKLDFSELLDKLMYFYDMRGETKLHIKIMDYALDSLEDKVKFYELFGNISDSLGIEYASPIYPYVDYDKVLGDKEKITTQFGLPILDIKVCPHPFYRVFLLPDGKITPCFSMEYPEIIGDINKKSVVDIWNGGKLRKFRCKMFNGREFNKVCSKCQIIKLRLFNEDILDNDVERLKKIYACR